MSQAPSRVLDQRWRLSWFELCFFIFFGLTGLALVFYGVRDLVRSGHPQTPLPHHVAVFGLGSLLLLALPLMVLRCRAIWSEHMIELSKQVQLTERQEHTDLLGAMRKTERKLDRLLELRDALGPSVERLQKVLDGLEKSATPMDASAKGRLMTDLEGIKDDLERSARA